MRNVLLCGNIWLDGKCLFCRLLYVYFDYQANCAVSRFRCWKLSTWKMEGDRSANISNYYRRCSSCTSSDHEWMARRRLCRFLLALFPLFLLIFRFLYPHPHAMRQRCIATLWPKCFHLDIFSMLPPPPSLQLLFHHMSKETNDVQI